MSEQDESRSSLEQEFETLGKNIREALEGAWDSEERRRLSAEIQRGLNEIGNTLGKVASDLKQNETVQRVSEDVDEFTEQIRSGDVADRLKAGTVDVLQTLNRQLEEWIQQLAEKGESGEEES